MRFPLLAAALVLAAPITSCDTAMKARKNGTALAREDAERDVKLTRNAPTSARGAVASEAETPAQNPFPAFALDPAADLATRLVIRTGQAGIEVDSLEPALGALRAVAQRVGGFMGNASVQTGHNQVRQATVEIKVPAERFDDLTEGLRPLGRVEFLNVSAEDVSEEFVDLTARVANARRLEERLLELLATRTGKLQDVLSVERELARVREEIERMEGRLRFLRARAQLSTLSVGLHEAPPLVADRPGSNPLAEALRQAWRNLVGVLAGGIAALGYLVPVAALVWGTVVGARRFARKPAAAKA